MKYKKTLLSTRQMVVVGVLAAISILMGLTPLGFIPLPTVNATILQIPIIIGAIIEGPVVGIFLGLIVGVVSMFKAMSNPASSLLAFAFINPLVSVLPRLLIGPVAYLFYSILRRFRRPSIGIIGAAVSGTLINTVGVLGMIYILYAQDLTQKISSISELAAYSVKTLLWGIVATNGIAEVAVSVVLLLILIPIIQKVKKNKS